LGTVAAKYRLHGDLVDVTFSIVITTNGTGAGAVQFTLPFTATELAFGAGRETVATGVMCNIQAVPASNVANVWTYDNSYPGGNGRTIAGSISFRK
jgi:hypothetical protein